MDKRRNENEQETIKSIAAYRKKRRKKRWAKTILILLLAAGISYVALMGYRNFTENQEFSDSASGFPIALKGDTIYGCDTIESNIALLTDKNLMIYSKSGKEKQEMNHGYFNPSMDCNENFCLLFDIGSTQFKLLHSGGVLYEKTTENKILFGRVASNGYSAIVTEDERYQCRLTIYNKNGNEIFRWYAAEGIVTALSFNSGENGCMVTTLNTEKGIPVTTLYGLSFSKSNELYHTAISNIMAIAVAQIGNRIHVIGDSEMVVLNMKGNQLKTFSYPDHLKQAAFPSNQYTVLLLGENIKSNNTVLVLDTNGQKVSSRDFEDDIRKIDCDSHHVVLLTREQILTLDIKLNTKKTYDNKSGVIYLAHLDKNGYDINLNQIDRFALE